MVRLPARTLHRQRANAERRTFSASFSTVTRTPGLQHHLDEPARGAFWSCGSPGSAARAPHLTAGVDARQVDSGPASASGRRTTGRRRGAAAPVRTTASVSSWDPERSAGEQLAVGAPNPSQASHMRARPAPSPRAARTGGGRTRLVEPQGWGEHEGVAQGGRTGERHGWPAIAANASPTSSHSRSNAPASAWAAQPARGSHLSKRRTSPSR